MNVIETLTQRNATYATKRFAADLKIMPSLKTMIVGCVDPRVDPFDVLELAPGEAAVIRNVGGRITPATFRTMAMLRVVAKASGGDLGPGWNLIVLHHTDCGIAALTQTPQMLATYFGVPPTEFDASTISDPYRSVAIDVAALKANPNLPGAFLVTGMVYDVASGRVEITVPSALLRSE